MDSPQQLRNGDLSGGFGTHTVARCALAMARIQQHLGHRAPAAEFARIGLDALGEASGLRAALQALAA